MTSPSNLAELLAEMERRLALYGSGYPPTNTGTNEYEILNLAPRLVQAAERMMEGLECDCGGVCHGANANLDPEFNWCGPCIMRRDVDAIAAGKSAHGSRTT